MNKEITQKQLPKPGFNLDGELCQCDCHIRPLLHMTPCCYPEKPKEKTNENNTE